MVDQAAFNAELASLRAEIDEIDQQIMLLLGVRFRCTDMIGELKQQYGIAPGDAARRAQQLERIQLLAAEAGVPPELAARILAAVIDSVLENHRRLRERPYS